MDCSIIIICFGLETLVFYSISLHMRACFLDTILFLVRFLHLVVRFLFKLCVCVYIWRGLHMDEFWVAQNATQKNREFEHVAIDLQHIFPKRVQ